MNDGKAMRRIGAWLVALLMVGMSACGGGGGDLAGLGGGVGSGGTGSSVQTVSVGPISGFGSIIVNGVKYDDSTASLSGDDASAIARADLRLGMMVEVRGSTDAGMLTGVASTVNVFSELKGIVSGATTSGFTLSGVSVKTTSATVYDGASVIANGDYVEVYGVFDPVTGGISATRIEKKSLGSYKLRGTVTALDTTNRRFTMAGQLTDYSGLSGSLPSGFGNGASVRAISSVQPGGTGAWPISGLTLVEAVSLDSTDRAEIKGYVTRFASIADFDLEGLHVDGSNATFDGGTASLVAVGARLEIKGSVSNGVIHATKIEIEDSGGSGTSQSGGSEFELKGLITSFTSTADFTVRNTRIDATGSVVYEGGGASGLKVGACVEIKGTAESGASGTIVRASKIQYENDCSST